MNTKMLGLSALIASAALASAATPTPSADAVPAAPKQEQHREIRIIKEHGMKQPMEMATFLGVITAPVSPELTSQLSLPECTGLLVMTVMDDSPASSALKKHDILLKLDDQILIETRQLAVLIRSKKAGDEVTLTLIRLGKEQTVKVKLDKKEMPKLAFAAPPLPRMMEMPFPHMQGNGFQYRTEAPMAFGQSGPEDPDVVLHMLHEAPGAQMKIIERRSGGIPHAAMLEPGRSTMLFNDDAGSIEVTINDGKKAVVAKDNSGKEIFAGPANTPEEMKAMPEAVRTKVEKILSKDEFGFEADSIETTNKDGKSTIRVKTTINAHPKEAKVMPDHAPMPPAHEPMPPAQVL